MKLSDYDGKCVRIVDFEGDVFEGICSYNNEAYMEHEYGVHEECLQLANFIFYRSHIKDIESLEGNCGPYGRFTSCYRRLEELNIEDGINSIREVLFSEENEHIFRLLLCLDRHLDTYYEYELKDRDEVLKSIKELLNTEITPEIREKAGGILKRYC